jgi:hypothetical protein
MLARHRLSLRMDDCASIFQLSNDISDLVEHMEVPAKLNGELTKETPQRAVKIFGDFKVVKENIKNLSAGKYLYIETNFKSEPIYIPQEEFSGLLYQAKHKPEVDILTDSFDVGIGVGIPVREVKKPDFSDLMRFLVEKIGVTFNDNQDEVIVASNNGIFLELPWEEVVDKKIFVFREVSPERKKETASSENGLLFIVSHAVKYGGENLEPIKEKLDEEIKNLLDSLIDSETPSRFKLQNLFLSMHSTKDSMKSMQWAKFNYIHLIAHGLPTGEICLEDPTDHEKTDPISPADFLKIIGQYSFKLFFFSFCYSAGGVEAGESLAFQILSRGISKHVIGYSYSIGGQSASTFAKYFYDNLLNGDKNEKGEDRLKIIYKEALEKFYAKNNGMTEYVPFLYMYT